MMLIENNNVKSIRCVTVFKGFFVYLAPRGAAGRDDFRMCSQKRVAARSRPRDEKRLSCYFLLSELFVRTSYPDSKRQLPDFSGLDIFS